MKSMANECKLEIRRPVTDSNEIPSSIDIGFIQLRRQQGRGDTNGGGGMIKPNFHLEVMNG
jgi:hypothetical protein